MSDAPLVAYISPTLHHAIDQLTAVTIDLQHLRRQQRSAAPPDALHVAEALHQIEDRLHVMARLLVALREESVHTIPTIVEQT